MLGEHRRELRLHALTGGTTCLAGIRQVHVALALRIAAQGGQRVAGGRHEQAHAAVPGADRGSVQAQRGHPEAGVERAGGGAEARVAGHGAVVQAGRYDGGAAGGLDLEGGVQGGGKGGEHQQPNHTLARTLALSGCLSHRLNKSNPQASPLDHFPIASFIPSSDLLNGRKEERNNLF